MSRAWQEGPLRSPLVWCPATLLQLLLPSPASGDAARCCRAVPRFCSCDRRCRQPAVGRNCQPTSVHICVHAWLWRCRYDTEEERKTLLPVLRDLSRQEYLKKREEAKLVSGRVYQGMYQQRASRVE